MATIERGETGPCLLAASIGDFVRVRAHSLSYPFVEPRGTDVIRLDRTGAEFILIEPWVTGSR